MMSKKEITIKKVFYVIFEKNGWLEYHLGTELCDVVNGQALSKKIKKDNPNAVDCLISWINEAKQSGFYWIRYNGDGAIILG